MEFEGFNVEKFCLKCMQNNIGKLIYKNRQTGNIYCENCFKIVCNESTQKNRIKIVEPLLNIKCWIFIRYEQNQSCISDHALQKKLDIINQFMRKNYVYRKDSKLLSEEFLEYCYTHLNETVPAELLLKFSEL